MNGKRIRWLPEAHITHGYRRVFVIEENSRLKNVVVFSLMGYEEVFQVKQKFKTHTIEDPSLLWGLSLIKTLIGTSLLTESEDGYVSLRPRPLEENEWIAIESFLAAVKHSEFILEAD